VPAARASAFRAARLAAALALLLPGPGCDSGPKRPTSPVRSVTLAPGPHPQAVITLEKLGTIRLELFPEAAPETVAMFMIQGGCPNTRDADPRNDGKGGGEIVPPDEFNDLPHARGTLSLANRGYRSSGGTQFFIVQRDAHQLDGKHTVFGRVVEGMEVVDAIMRLEIDKYGRYGPPDRPYPVSAVVESIRIEPVAEGQSG
jgi:cyclophilin family peptidyl-prolyl cis-trans isomerase